ncbi:hypothetical protein CAPTEDRAFT_217449 [Capitella teleta]|uniref:SUEL-type lectin domain-containing protein n=1 Tax=Capitella teleta TaxID=283909 RepID=R7UHE0_CAPTE|nr:hypothetical protein CAPTEDRAFT_217449 [Capitella teleta]|eukprot:ELU05605.1 hypothetical protein CAPTEDRAFT_217449 [Capitella teleta]
MDTSTIFMIITITRALFLFIGCNAVEVSLRGKWGKVYDGEFCDYEEFSANCNDGEVLQILQAAYGHIEVGKCVIADIGFLGCQADVTDIIKNVCNGKKSCFIEVNDQKLRDTAPCQPGIEKYVQASYACLKAASEFEICRGLSARPSIQYIPSQQILNPGCSGANHVRISGQKGQNISFSAIRLTEDEITSVGLIINEETQEHIPINLQHRNNQLGSLKANTVSLALDQLPPNSAFILGYQGICMPSLLICRLHCTMLPSAIGCADIPAPKDSTVTRTDTEATIVCIHTEQKWNLKCRGVHWLGIIGNCTKRNATAKPKVIPPVIEDSIIEKDVIYVIVICITVFLSVLVITTGYVCLRTARIQSGLECRKKPAEPEWAFGANQTMTLLAKQRPDSDYLQPMYPGDAQNVMPAAIYDTPPPNPMQVPQDNTCTSVKQNNDEDYNATVSSTSTDYKKYFVLDKDYMNTKEFINDV